MADVHVPLPDDLYEALREQSERENRPVSALANEAISAWLAARKRRDANAELQAYIERWAGTDVDRDPALEQAGLEAIAEG